MNKIKKQAGSAGVSVIVFLFFFVIFFGAWLTHIINCLQNERWGFLIAGAIAFPIAIIHGWGLWLGIF
jgi:tetrahydromethanopterin S-methyltransferase subunit E